MPWLILVDRYAWPTPVSPLTAAAPMPAATSSATWPNDGCGRASVSISDLNTTAGASPSTAWTAMQATTSSPGRQ